MTFPRFRSWPLAIVLLLIYGLAFECFGPDIPRAGAATFPPCLYHKAGDPYIPYVGDTGPYLESSGSISGCPSPGLAVIGYTISVTDTLQSRVADGSWTDVSSCTQTKGIGRYWRYARAAACTVPAVVCYPGDWRSIATGRDADGSTWYSESNVVRFPPSDEGENGCGEPGGA